jgi:hypothetical protein
MKRIARYYSIASGFCRRPARRAALGGTAWSRLARKVVEHRRVTWLNTEWREVQHETLALLNIQISANLSTGAHRGAVCQRQLATASYFMRRGAEQCCTGEDQRL